MTDTFFLIVTFLTIHFFAAVALSNLRDAKQICSDPGALRSRRSLEVQLFGDARGSVSKLRVFFY